MEKRPDPIDRFMKMKCRGITMLILLASLTCPSMAAASDLDHDCNPSGWTKQGGFKFQVQRVNDDTAA